MNYFTIHNNGSVFIIDIPHVTHHDRYGYTLLTSNIYSDIEDAERERDHICKALKLKPEDFELRYLD